MDIYKPAGVMGMGQKQSSKTATVERQDSGKLEEGRFFGGVVVGY